MTSLKKNLAYIFFFSHKFRLETVDIVFYVQIRVFWYINDPIWRGATSGNQTCQIQFFRHNTLELWAFISPLLCPHLCNKTGSFICVGMHLSLSILFGIPFSLPLGIKCFWKQDKGYWVDRKFCILFKIIVHISSALNLISVNFKW